MKKLISFVVLFAAFLAAPSSLADDLAGATDSLKLGMGAVSSVPKKSIKCGEVAQVEKGPGFGAVQTSSTKPVDRVHASWGASNAAR